MLRNASEPQRRENCREDDPQSMFSTMLSHLSMMGRYYNFVYLEQSSAASTDVAHHRYMNICCEGVGMHR